MGRKGGGGRGVGWGRLRCTGAGKGSLKGAQGKQKGGLGTQEQGGGAWRQLGEGEASHRHRSVQGKGVGWLSVTSKRQPLYLTLNWE